MAFFKTICRYVCDRFFLGEKYDNKSFLCQVYSIDLRCETFHTWNRKFLKCMLVTLIVNRQQKMDTMMVTCNFNTVSQMLPATS